MLSYKISNLLDLTESSSIKNNIKLHFLKKTKLNSFEVSYALNI